MHKILLAAAIYLAGCHYSAAQWVPGGFSFLSSAGSTLAAVDSNCVWTAEVVFSGAKIDRTIDGGQTWHPANYLGFNPAGFTQIQDFVATDSTTCFYLHKGTYIAGPGAPPSLAGTIYKTSDGGQTWTISLWTSWLNALGFFTPQEGLAVGEQNNGGFRIFTTQDEGTSWSQVNAANVPAPISGTEQPVDGSVTVRGSSAWFYTTQGRVFSTTDKGATWAVGTAFPGIEHLTFRDADHGLLKTTGQLFGTTDGGSNWSVINYTGNISGAFSYVPQTAQTYSSGQSYTTDDGLTWLQLPNPGFSNVRNAQFTDRHNAWAIAGSQVVKYAGQALAGLPANAAELRLQVYPNPSAGTVHLTSPVLRRGLPGTQLKVTDLFGRVLRVQQADSQIDLIGLKPGIYLIELVSGKQRQQALITLI